jgi:hypothetical protein
MCLGGDWEVQARYMGGTCVVHAWCMRGTSQVQAWGSGGDPFHVRCTHTRTSARLRQACCLSRPRVCRWGAVSSPRREWLKMSETCGFEGHPTAR